MTLPGPQFDNVVISNNTTLNINSTAIVMGGSANVVINALSMSMNAATYGLVINASTFYIGNSLVSTLANSTIDIFSANATTQTWANTMGIYVGNLAIANASLNTTTLQITGNSTGTNSSLTLNAITFYLGNTTSFRLANSSIDIFTANATTQTWGNTTGIYAGNLAVGNASLTSTSLIFAGNSTGVNTTTTMNSYGFYFGNATVNTIHNGSGIYVGQLAVGNAVLTTLGLTFTGNSTGINSTAVVNATSISIGANTTGNTIITETSVSVGLGNAVLNTAGLWITNSTGIVNSAVINAGTLKAANLTLSTNTLYCGINTIGTNGYATLTSGLLCQWGRVNANSTLTSQTFPHAFGTACFAVVGSANATNISFCVVNSNTTVFVCITSSATMANCMYIAIGN